MLGVATDANDLQPARVGSLRRTPRVCRNVEVDVIVQPENTTSASERTVTLMGIPTRGLVSAQRGGKIISPASG